MSHSEQIRRWQEIEAYLRKAAQFLPDLMVSKDGVKSTQVKDALRLCFEFLDHNELELALYELEYLGEENAVPPEYWQNLAAAAKLMELHERANQSMDQFKRSQST
jgi:hypothetical protein